jgi:hypothetical protein
MSYTTAPALTLSFQQRQQQQQQQQQQHEQRFLIKFSKFVALHSKFYHQGSFFGRHMMVIISLHSRYRVN